MIIKVIIITIKIRTDKCLYIPGFPSNLEKGLSKSEESSFTFKVLKDIEKKTILSCFYFGFFGCLFPNTALQKLNQSVEDYPAVLSAL